jgi:hypothetical protein
MRQSSHIAGTAAFGWHTLGSQMNPIQRGQSCAQGVYSKRARTKAVDRDAELPAPTDSGDFHEKATR